MANRDWFDDQVPLPPGLDVAAIGRAIDYIERELSELVDLYYEQANVFSAVVGIFGTKALDAHSVYEKPRHLDTAQQRFPDLKRRGSGDPSSPRDSLESKASKRPWAIPSHYDHTGWYVVWRYLVDPTESMDKGKTVIVWRVDIVFLDKKDWKYESSRAGAGGGGRTHTFGVVRPATRLKGTAVFRRPDIVIKDGKPVPTNGTGTT